MRKPICRASPSSRSCSTTKRGPDEQAQRGFLAPGWSLDLALGQMKELRKPAAADSGNGRSIATRTAAKGIAGDWRARATQDRRDSRSIPRSTARSPLSAKLRPSDQAAARRLARPATGTKSTPPRWPRRRPRSLTAGRGPSASACSRSRNQRRSSTTSCKRSGLHAGHRRRTADRAQHIGRPALSEHRCGPRAS